MVLEEGSGSSSCAMVGLLLTGDGGEVCHGGQDVSNSATLCCLLTAIVPIRWRPWESLVGLDRSFNRESGLAICHSSCPHSPPKLVADHAHLPRDILAVVLVGELYKFEMGIMQKDGEHKTSGRRRGKERWWMAGSVDIILASFVVRSLSVPNDGGWWGLGEGRHRLCLFARLAQAPWRLRARPPCASLWPVTDRSRYRSQSEGSWWG